MCVACESTTLTYSLVLVMENISSDERSFDLNEFIKPNNEHDAPSSGESGHVRCLERKRGKGLLVLVLAHSMRREIGEAISQQPRERCA